MNKDIKPYNKEGQQHGWWEIYLPLVFFTHYKTGTPRDWAEKKILYKGNYINGKRHGYYEWGSGNKEFHLR